MNLINPSPSANPAPDNQAPKGQTPTPIILIAGFLGAGKTTLINHLLSQPEMARSALVINEFGSVSIDDDLIRAQDHDTIIELAGGCVCCAMQATLAQTLQGLADAGFDQIDRVLVETTGLANVGPIVHTIVADEELMKSCRFDRVITVFDAVNGPATLDRHPESVEQVAVADVIVITKSDLITSTDQSISRLQKLNPTGSIIVADHGRAPVAELLAGPQTENLAALRKATVTNGDDSHPHDAHISTVTITRQSPIDEPTLAAFWAAVAEVAGANLLRVKGLIRVSGREGPALVQGAQDTMAEITYFDSWPTEDRTTRVVFIGWQLDGDEIANLLDGDEPTP